MVSGGPTLASKAGTQSLDLSGGGQPVRPGRLAVRNLWPHQSDKRAAIAGPEYAAQTGDRAWQRQQS